MLQGEIMADRYLHEKKLKCKCDTFESDKEFRIALLHRRLLFSFDNGHHDLLNQIVLNVNHKDEEVKHA